jgi:hypothetical protein
MEPEHIRFGGGASATVLHPLVAIAVLLAIVMILLLPRKNVIIPFLFTVLMTPWGQVVVIGGVHFTMMRVLILAALVRGIWSKATSSEEWFGTGFSKIDQAIVLWLVCSFIIVTLQWMNPGMLIASLGDLVDSLGGYLVLRFLVFEGDSIRLTTKVLAIICMIHAVCMVNEQITGLNVFTLLGGVSIDAVMRAGHLRSSGVMGPLGEGVFAGVLVPLFWWLSTEKKSRRIAQGGLVGATTMLITTHASTPWLAVGGALLGLGFWPLRKELRTVRWGFVLTLVALHLYMKSPVWHLISDVNLSGDSSSYHRYTLVNQTVLHFRDWWLLGSRNYASWDWDMWDTSNLFVATALSGGLVSLIFLIAAFKRGFAAIGTARKAVQGDRTQEKFIWCLGSALFAVVVSSFGVAFVGLLQIELFTLLACISVATFEAMRLAEPRTTGVPALAFAPVVSRLPRRLATMNRVRTDL